MTNDVRPIKGLGEIAFRVNNLDKMQEFYEEVIGLELMRRFDHAVFFKIAEGVEGHTQILALFDRSDSKDYSAPESKSSTVDNFGFVFPKYYYE